VYTIAIYGRLYMYDKVMSEVSRFKSLADELCCLAAYMLLIIVVVSLDLYYL